MNGVTDESKKCMMIIDSGLPHGLKMNTIVLLGVRAKKSLTHKRFGIASLVSDRGIQIT